MSNKDKNQKQQRILSDHKRVGKRFIPPFLQRFDPTELTWANYILPELLWIGLLNHQFGLQKGAALALALAQAADRFCDVRPKPLFAAVSSYTGLKSEHKKIILENLRKHRKLEYLQKALYPFHSYYPECPLNFLFRGNFIIEKPAGDRDITESCG